MDRRSFLLLGGAAFAYPIIKSALRRAPPPEPADFELVSGYGRWVDSAIDQVDPSLPSRLVFYNPGDGTMSDFAVPFRVHMLVQNPRRPEQLVLISKWGAELASFNRRSGQVENVERARANHRFFGHAVWDRVENGFWVTEQDDEAFAGKIVLRDENLAIRREVQSYGIYPHDVQMPEPGILTVANNGDYYGLATHAGAKSPEGRFRVSSLNWIRARDGKPLRQIRFPELLGRAGASHFQFLTDQRSVFVGAKTKSDDDPSIVMRISADGIVTTLQPPAKERGNYRGEAVSFALSGDRVVWTHSKEKGVFSAQVAGDTVQLLTPTRTRGIAGVGSDLIVSHAKKPILLKISGEKVIQEIEGPAWEEHRWGSHFSRIKAI